MAREKIKALGLCSGGLDSILSAMVLREQSIHVEWIAFETPFFLADKAKKASEMTSIPLRVENITAEYLKMLKDPRCGYGKNMNPCMDCHALMFRLAGEVMSRENFHFLFSGEVLGQRPMSQTRTSLRYVEKHSGMAGYILRPLSAKRLEETEVEKRGWVDRDRLLDITGRSRKRQIALAEKFGISQYPAPVGGCLLTDKGFSKRLRELFDQRDEPCENNLMLLRHGRHFRSENRAKIIVGRTKSDNENILRFYNPKKDTFLTIENFPSPAVLIPGGGGFGDVQLASAICAGYAKLADNTPVEVHVKTPLGNETVVVLPLKPAQVKHLLI